MGARVCTGAAALIEWLPVDALLAAASAALGAPLADPVDLGGSKRSTVLRCRDSSGGTVVVKSYPQTAEGARNFAAEASGLAFASGAGLGPRLLGADPAVPLIVMTDLGAAPSLADLLLGESWDAAQAALLSWALACGQLAVRTAGRQRELASMRGELASLRGELTSLRRGLAGLQAPQPGGGGASGARHWLAERIESAPGLLGALDIVPPAGLADDLAAVAAILEPGAYEVFSPGDICPDNNLCTGSGMRFIDYENAEFHSVFLDAAYLRMPFSTCWCVFRLPGDLAAAAEAAYRAEVSGLFADLASDAVWRPGVLRAVAAWTIHAMAWLLAPSVVRDAPMHDSRTPVPSARQLLRYRWQVLRDELESACELPALAGLTRSLLAATEHWQVPDLPAYPAFRRNGS